VNVVEWELFVPDRFRVDRFAGDMLDAALMTSSVVSHVDSGQIIGRVTDRTGAPIPGATISVDASGRRQNVITDENGSYSVSNLPNGTVTVTGQLPGFVTVHRNVQLDQRGREVDLRLEVGGVTESVTVMAEAPVINTRQSSAEFTFNAPREQQGKKTEAEAPSVNVQNLQRRASGVLPVRMEVPRAGTSHRFVKPLVIDEETKVTFRYKRR
jgi:hypothetical protein